MPIEIRQLHPSDAALIMPIMSSAFDPAFGEAWRLDQCAATLLLPGSALYSAYQDDVIVGFSLIQSLFENSELMLLAVHPEYRGQSIGKILVQHWESFHLEAGGKQLFLEVRENNPALHFYKSLDFEVVGRRPNYYKTMDGNPLAALTMNKKICPIY